MKRLSSNRGLVQQIAINESSINALAKLGFELARNEINPEALQIWNSAEYMKVQSELDFKDSLIDEQMKSTIDVLDDIDLL